MRWTVFAIFAYVAVSLDVGLEPLLKDPFGLGIGCPSFTLLLAVYVGMSAPALSATWSALLLGILVDLRQDYVFSGYAGTSSILGPAALGYLVAAQAVLQVRTTGAPWTFQVPAAAHRPTSAVDGIEPPVNSYPWGRTKITSAVTPRGIGSAALPMSNTAPPWMLIRLLGARNPTMMSSDTFNRVFEVRSKVKVPRITIWPKTSSEAKL